MKEEENISPHGVSGLIRPIKKKKPSMGPALVLVLSLLGILFIQHTLKMARKKAAEKKEETSVPSAPKNQKNPVYSISSSKKEEGKAMWVLKKEYKNKNVLVDGKPVPAQNGFVVLEPGKHFVAVLEERDTLYHNVSVWRSGEIRK